MLCDEKIKNVTTALEADAAPLSIGDAVFVAASVFPTGNIIQADYTVIAGEVIATDGKNASVMYRRGGDVNIEIGVVEIEACFRSAEECQRVVDLAQLLHDHAVVEFRDSVAPCRLTREAMDLLSEAGSVQGCHNSEETSAAVTEFLRRYRMGAVQAQVGPERVGA